MERLVFLDSEFSGGAAADRIIEIGMVEMIDGKLTGNTFHALVSVDVPIHWAAYKVHGIKKSHLEGKPRFSEIATQVLDFMKGASVFAHNANSDDRMLLREWKTINLANEDHPGLKCTARLAKKVVGLEGLDSLMRELLPHRSPRGKHNALDDAQILAEVFLKMRELDPKTVNALIEAPSPVRGPKKERPKKPYVRKGIPDYIARALYGPSISVETQIERANDEHSTTLALGIQVQHDKYSAMKLDELIILAGPDLAERSQEVPERRAQVLRMILRGLDPQLAISREQTILDYKRKQAVRFSANAAPEEPVEMSM